MYLKLQERTLKHSYLCLSACPPYREAGSPWSVTKPWIDSLRSDETLSCAVGRLADEHAFMKRDLFTVFMHGNDIDPESTLRPGEPPLWKVDPEKSFSDWTIEISRREGGSSERYDVHRTILAFGPRRSNYLARMFREECIDKTSRLTLENSMADALPLLLNYVYAKACPSNGEFEAFCSLAKHLEVALPNRTEESHSKKAYDPDKTYSVGDKVHYRHPGGSPGSGIPFVMPAWFAANVTSCTEQGLVELSVDDPAHSRTWNVTVDPKVEVLLDDMAIGSPLLVSDACNKAQCKLAEHFKYLNYSAIAPNRRVKVLWFDGQVYDAVTMIWSDMDWSGFVRDEIYKRNPTVGAHVLVDWVEEDAYSLVPVGRVALAEEVADIPKRDLVELMTENAQASESVALEDMTSPHDALLKSLESRGASICNARDVLGTSEVNCYWLEDREWLDAEALHPSEIFLEDLAVSREYDVAGQYCLVRFAGEEEQYLIPMRYVRRRDWERR